MMSLPFKKQICMEGGYMLDSMISSGLGQVVCLIGGLFGFMLSFYLSLCFIQWVGDFIESKPWRFWK